MARRNGMDAELSMTVPVIVACSAKPGTDSRV
jgi:hypothetical protein